MMHRAFFSALLTALIWLGTASSTLAAFDPQRTSIVLEVKGVKSDYAIFSVTAMPGEKLVIKTAASATAEDGSLARVPKGWLWTAPRKPGLVTIRFAHDGDQSRLNVFVLTPWHNGVSKSLNGFRIGSYRKTPFKGLKSYAAPSGFIEADASLLAVRVSPHFTLGQFKSKQQPDVEPAYLLINPATLLKLERLLEAVNNRGWEVDTLTVMSGFRTPYYNAAIGNKTTSSRHLYGGAADVFVDADGNDWMDDLNGDGVIDKKDAVVLADLAESLAKRDPSAWRSGGLAAYAENSVRGPFVHLDARGYQARWGR